MKQAMKGMPLVSVVMTVYNGERYLKEALQSVFSQTYQNFEIIIVIEYGTHDHTFDILNSFHDSRLRVVINKTRLGVSPSLNIGLEMAKGKYIARIDDDDIWIRNKLERQILFLEKHPDVGMCGSNAYIINNRGKIVNVCVYPAKSRAVKMSLYISNCFISSAVLMRKSIIKRYGLQYSGNVCEDYWLWINISMYAEVENLPNFLVGYRVFEGNRTSHLIAQQEKRDREIHSFIWEKAGISYPFDKSFYAKSVRYRERLRKYHMLIELSQTPRFRNRGMNDLAELLYKFQSMMGTGLFDTDLPEMNYLFKFYYLLHCKKKKLERKYHEKRYIGKKCRYKQQE